MYSYLTVLFGNLDENECIHLRFGLPDGKGYERNAFLGSIEDAVSACQMKNGKRHVHAAINPRDWSKASEEIKKRDRREGGSGGGGKNTVSRVTCIFSDYDTDKFHKTKEEGLATQHNLPCPPSMIVDSGGGLHPYWLLATPVTSEEDKAFAERIMSAMCLWWETDKVTDYSRILRVPGTLNIKPGYDPPPVCRLIEEDNGNRYTLDQLWGMIPEEYRTPKKTKSVESTNGSYEVVGNPLAPPDTPLSEGDGRNARITSAAGALVKKGLSRTDIGYLLTSINECDRWFADPLPGEEIRGLMGSVDRWVVERESRNGHVPNLSSPSPSPNGSYGDDNLPTVLEFHKQPRPTGKQPYLVGDCLPENYPTVFFGDSGTLKSTLAGHLGQCVARGIPWLGHETKKTKVLILDFELDANTQSRRAYDTATGMGYTHPPEGYMYMECAGYSPKTVFEEARRICVEEGVGLLLVDSLGVALEGDAEASRDVIGFMRGYVDTWRAAGITTLIVDHQGKLQANERYQNKTQFGSAYKKHLSRSVFQIQKREGEEGESKLTLRHTKNNFGMLLDPFGVSVQWGHERIGITPDDLSPADLAGEDTVNVSTRILMALEDGPMFPNEIAEVVEAQLGTVKNRLTTLRKQGRVEDTGIALDRSKQVRLPLSSPSLPLRYGDGDDRNIDPLEVDPEPQEEIPHKTMRERTQEIMEHLETLDDDEWDEE
jgi:hypothetical protein